jgi:acetyl-CoA C-acetyltransferase
VSGAQPSPRRLPARARSLLSAVRWLKGNPDVLVRGVRGLLPGGEPPTPVAEHALPAELADYPRTAHASTDVPVAGERARGLVEDLGRIGEWLTMHQGWLGAAPSGAAVGATFVQKVKIMGIPADVAWEVVEVTPERIGMRGAGPMGLAIAMWLTTAPGLTGTRVAVDAGVGGDPITGPMGASVVRSVQEALAESLARLAALLREQSAGDEGPRFPTAPVRHRASGQTLDGRTPVIVGVGQVVERDPSLDRLLDPAELAARALRSAATDAGVDSLLTTADSVFAVASASWPYHDLAAVVAERVGARPRHTVMSARFGGDAGQVLLNEAGQRIVDGDAAVVLVCGAEAGASLSLAQKAGVTPDWPRQSPDTAPDRVVGSEREPNTPAETSAGLNIPVYAYALIEQALRGRSGATPEEHTRMISELWSSFSEVAAGNPYAWMPQAMSAERLATTDADNRMISTPYPKLLCANLQVDLASGIVLTSAAAAQAAGVPQDRWVFLHAGAAAHDEWFVSERGDLTSSPAIRTIGEVALAHAGVTIDEVDLVDLYSCFPAAVQIAARELGLPEGIRERPLTVTGGLTFAGGPGNNYGGHGIATMVPRLRRDPFAVGLTTSLGWFMTKHALGILSATPPRRAFRSMHPVPPPAPRRPALTAYEGPGVVESYTVDVDRDGGARAAIVSVLTPEGARVLVRTVQHEVAKAALEEDMLGWRVLVDDQELTLADRRPGELPEAPPMTVLLERRGPVAVITLNRPDRRNAVDLATAELLERVVDLVEQDPQVRVVVITGAGGTFCSGMDLKAAAAGEFAMTERGGPLGITSRPLRKPVVAAVEGHALAGGFELALVSDLVVAATGSEFGLPEPKRGLVAAAGGVLRVAQRLPRNVAMELALTGDSVPARRMAELGLVNRLAEPGQVLAAAVALAEEIAANAPLSVEVSKRIIDESPDWSVAEAFARQSELAGVAVTSEDAAEGVAAFAERRAPVWKGR